VGLLRKLGYSRVRAHFGGMAEWTQAGLPLEHGAAAVSPRARSASATVGGAPAALARRGFDRLGTLSLGGVLAAWVGMVLGFGLVYWLGDLLPGSGLRAGAGAPPHDLGGLATAVYFSFVTATSVGYGDVAPTGWLRVPAVIEAAGGLLVFGFVVSRLVSRRQEELTAEIHRIAFEDRLGRVRTNLHLVLSVLQTTAETCREGRRPPAGVQALAESAMQVFAGELATIHDLLYRPQELPEERVLAGLLVSLAAALEQLIDLMSCLPEDVPRPATFDAPGRDRAPQLGDLRRLRAARVRARPARPHGSRPARRHAPRVGAGLIRRASPRATRASRSARPAAHRAARA